MTRLGIFAPYRRGEATAAACVLADLAVSMGVSVRWYSHVPVERGVHPAWDGAVRRCKDPDWPAEWAAGCDHFVWFAPAAWPLAAVRVFAPLAGHTLVPAWHRLEPQEAEQAPEFPHAVFATERARDAFLAAAYKGRPGVQLDVCPWDVGFDPVPRSPAPGDRVRVFARLDSSACDDAGPQVLSAVRDALSGCPAVSVTLARDKSWPARLYAEAKGLARRWPGRFRVLDRLSLEEETLELSAHDWAWCPATRSDFGLDALRALYLGLPVLAHDVEPYRGLAGLCPGSRLLPCEVNYNALGAPAAVPLAGAFLRALASGPADPWHTPPAPRVDLLVERRARFRAYWADRWGLVPG